MEVKKHIYIIRAGDHYYKIGISRRPQKRQYQIDGACPLKTELIYKREFGDNAEFMEKFLHRKFTVERKHIKGEWFFLSEIDVKDIIKYLDAGDLIKFKKEFEE